MVYVQLVLSLMKLYFKNDLHTGHEKKANKDGLIKDVSHINLIFFKVNVLIK